jgi:periplasmic divalent cation tolerance protein
MSILVSKTNMDGDTDAHLVVLVSAANDQDAWNIAKTAIERKLAARAQIFPIRSCYTLQGSVVEDNEHLVLLKTHQDMYEHLEACIRTLHSFEVSEIIALPVSTGFTSYLDWIDETVLSQQRESCPG